jgi:hypothetical protein
VGQRASPWCGGGLGTAHERASGEMGGHRGATVAETEDQPATLTVERK